MGWEMRMVPPILSGPSFWDHTSLIMQCLLCVENLTQTFLQLIKVTGQMLDLVHLLQKTLTFLFLEMLVLN